MFAAPAVILLRLLASLMAVVQQPTYLPAFVSAYNVTQFNPVREYGSIGLLAHDYGAGRMFENVSEGNFITVTLSDGTEVRYVVSEIVRARALEWGNPYSDFTLAPDASAGAVDDTRITSTQLVRRVFRQGYLTLQTCEGRGGRLFILARQR